MLEIIIRYTETGDILALCRQRRGSVSAHVYEGDFREWNVAAALKKHGKCIKLCYSGVIVSSVDKENDPLIVREIMESGHFICNDSQNDGRKLLFVRQDDLETVRNVLAQAGAVVIQEILSECTGEMRFPKLRLLGLTDDKLYKYILHIMKTYMLAASLTLLGISLASYIVSDYYDDRNAALRAEMAKTRKEAGKADTKARNMERLYSRMGVNVSPKMLYVFDRSVLSLMSRQIQITFMTVNGNVLTIEGVFESSSALAETMKEIRMDESVDDIEASRIDTDNAGNRVFTLRIWLR